MNALALSGIERLLGARSAAELQHALHQVLPLYAVIGLQIDRLGDEPVCSVPLTAVNSNHLGSMHAAVIWAVAEAVGGLAYFGNAVDLGNCWIVVRDFTIRFKKPPRTRVHARTLFGPQQREQVKADLGASGMADYALEVVLVDDHDGVVATATGQYHLRRPQSPSTVTGAV
jgi:acyl-coenzyme A thioesterase PaaI-like protein